MASLATDSFTRADGAIGGNWTNAPSPWAGLSVKSNAVGITSSL